MSFAVCIIGAIIISKLLIFQTLFVCYYNRLYVFKVNTDIYIYTYGFINMS